MWTGSVPVLLSVTRPGCCGRRRETQDWRVLPTLRALTAFFEAQPVIFAGYSLAGRPSVRYSHLAFTAPVHCMFKVRPRPLPFPPPV